MTDDLLTFENTLAVLAEYGEAVAAAYKDNLRRDGRPASHALEKSITTFVTTDRRDFVVKMSLEDYWKYTYIITFIQKSVKGCIYFI